MIRIEADTIIDAPVGKVWEYVSDFGTMAQWGPGVIKVDWQPPARIGSIATVTIRRFGRRTSRLEVKEWEPNHKIGVQARSGRTSAYGLLTMEQIESTKTKLTRSAQVEVGGLLKLLSPYISYRAKKERSVEIENIKRFIEARSA